MWQVCMIYIVNAKYETVDKKHVLNWTSWGHSSDAHLFSERKTGTYLES